MTHSRSRATFLRAIALLALLTSAVTAQKPDSAKVSKSSSPLALHVGDADLLIGGFMDATAVYRSTNTGSGIGSSFGTIPFANAAAGNLAETRFSAQNSRLTLQATSKHDGDDLKAYVEADFLGAAPANLNVTSNANTLRMRLYWVQYATPSWEVLAGQSWSLLTPNRSGVSPMPSDLFYSQDIDTNYQMGLTWGRTPGFRLTVKPASIVSAAVAVENPQPYVGTAVTLPGAFPAAEVDQSGNTAAANPMPDVIGKLAFDPKIGGLHQHLEVSGLLRSFKTWMPAVGAAPAATQTAEGKGAEAAAMLEPIKNFRLIGSYFLSNGGGRYIANINAPDFAVASNGAISPVSARSWIAGAEIQAAPKTLVYGYYSRARVEKDSLFDNTAVGASSTAQKPIGFGLAGTAANNDVKELTLGLVQTLFRNANTGGLQAMVQYSRVTRTPFTVPAGTPSPDASVNMVYFNFRYLLP